MLEKHPSASTYVYLLSIIFLNLFFAESACLELVMVLSYAVRCADSKTGTSALIGFQPDQK